ADELGVQIREVFRLEHDGDVRRPQHRILGPSTKPNNGSPVFRRKRQRVAARRQSLRKRELNQDRARWRLEKRSAQVPVKEGQRPKGIARKRLERSIVTGQRLVEVTARVGAAEGEAFRAVEGDDASPRSKEIVGEEGLQARKLSVRPSDEVLGSPVQHVERGRLGGHVAGHGLRPGRQTRKVLLAHLTFVRVAPLAAAPASRASCSNSRTVEPVVSASFTTSSRRAAASSGASSAADSCARIRSAVSIESSSVESDSLRSLERATASTRRRLNSSVCE